MTFVILIEIIEANNRYKKICFYFKNYCVFANNMFNYLLVVDNTKASNCDSDSVNVIIIKMK